MTFDRSAQRRFDLVIGADGIGSPVRKEVFGKDSPFIHSFDTTVAIFTGPNDIGVQDWQLSYQCGIHSSMMGPVRNNRDLRISTQVKVGWDQISRSDVEKKQLVVAQNSSMGWHMPRFLRAMMGR